MKRAATFLRKTGIVSSLGSSYVTEGRARAFWWAALIAFPTVVLRLVGEAALPLPMRALQMHELSFKSGQIVGSRSAAVQRAVNGCPEVAAHFSIGFPGGG
jgi:hypothetical protein